jgi:two-component system response regulator NreC
MIAIIMQKIFKIRSDVKGEGKEMLKKIQVLVAETHPILRNNFCLLLEQENDIEVLGATGDLEEALDLVQQVRPDVIVADISIPPGNGADLMQKVKMRSDSTSVLAITQYDDEDYIHKLLKAGASGLILKDSTISCLAGAVRKVGNGDTYLSPNISSKEPNNIII